MRVLTRGSCRRQLLKVVQKLVPGPFVTVVKNVFICTVPDDEPTALYIMIEAQSQCRNGIDTTL